MYVLAKNSIFKDFIISSVVKVISTENDMIIALATPTGEGAISVIRISGIGSIKIMDKVFKGKSILADAPTHTIHYGKISSNEGGVIDDVLVSIFKNPNSYTGEDSAEISTHASPIIVKRIIELMICHGVRLAEPGEFTKRAFLNGKIDLAQAEAVADIIGARTEASLRGARNQLDGILSRKVSDLRAELLSVSSLLELELDFAEEDLEFMPAPAAIKKINKIILEIDSLLDTYSFGRVIRDGVNVTIVGKPNVGKSSILNYILKEARAIVSEIPGTTRDIIREEVSIEGVLFKLYDTAGIRLTNDIIEKEGVERSRETIRQADIVLFINDVLDGISDELFNELIGLTKRDRIITVLNKIDLSNSDNIKTDLRVSALTGKGMEELMEVLKSKALGSKSYTEKNAVVSNIRHYNALQGAKTNLVNAKNSLLDKMTGEFISVDLRLGEERLGEIIGEVTTDDILNNIFSNFCIGK